MLIHSISTKIMSENILPIAVASSRRLKDRDGVPTPVQSTKIKRSTSKVDLQTPLEDESNKPDKRQVQGWKMVALVFLANFLVLGFFKSLGILTKILNKEFTETMHVYILMCITYSLNCAAGPVACYLTRTHSARSIALVGTSLVTFGLIISWFAKSLMFLYFSLGIPIGLGSGLTYPTGVILVGNYFAGTKYAPIANAFVVSGSPIGGMVMPLVVSWLSELYTSRGTFLIFGGLMFNAVICARSFKAPKVRENDDSSIERSSSNEGDRMSPDTANDTCNNNLPAIVSQPFATKCGETDIDTLTVDRNENILPVAIHEKQQSIMHYNSTSGVLKIFERDDEAEVTRRMETEASIESFCEHGHHHHPDQPFPYPITTKIGSGTKSVFLSGTGQTIHDMNSGTTEGTNIYLRPYETTKFDKGRMMVGSLPGLECYKKFTSNTNNSLGVFSDNEMICHYLENNEVLTRAAQPTEGKSAQSHKGPAQRITSGPYILALDHSCVILCSKSDIKKPPSQHHQPRKDHCLSANPPDSVDDDDDDGGGGDKVQKAAAKKNCWQRFQGWILTSPLRNSTYLFLLFSNTSTAISTTNIHLMISQIVMDTAGEYRKSSAIYFLMALADLSGRLVGGFLSSREVIPPSVIYGLGLVLAGISSSFFAMYSSFLILSVQAIAFGLSSGLHVGIYGLLLTNTVGIEKIHVGYGISMCLNGTLQCIAILLSGSTISSYRDSFVWLAPLLGGILAFGGIIWIFRLIFCDAGAVANKSRKTNNEDQ